MLIVSDELKNTFMKDERTIFVRIKIGNRTFDNNNVISVDYDAGSLSGEFFAIGSTYSNSIKITFSELVEGLKELDEVTYEIGIKLPNGTIEYVPMGVFVINDAIEMDRNNNKTTIVCMDRMVMMGGAYVSSLTYPAAIREVALEIANKAGIAVADTFDRLNADVIAKPEGYTYREAIGLIAQFEAGFATFDRYGKLEIRTLSDPKFAIPPDNYFSKGLVKNEVFFRLGGISCTTDDSDTVIQSGNTAGNQVVLENRVMTKYLLDKIYQKIQTINYYPFSLSWQGNPVLEAGDWIEVEDLQGNKFKTPNLSYSLSFNGGLSAKSSAETVTQSNATYQYKSPLQQKIEWIHARIDAAGGNVVFEGIDEPVNPKEGDLWFKIIGPDKEILIYRKREDGTLFWDPQISTADINKVAKELEKLFEQIELDREKAEQDVETAKQAAKDYTDTKSQEFDTKMDAIKQDITNITNATNDAVIKADKAIKDAGFAQADASAAKVSATNALSAANTAKADASSALTQATTAITDASKALTRVGAVEVTTGNLTTSYDALTRTVALKADQTTVDGIKGSVTNQGLAITANATALGLKADKTAVDTINNTVSKHTTDIKATADGLLLKADSSVVSTLGGTVTTHTTQIKAASDGLALKADSSVVNTIKGTVDTHSTQISANSQAITARLTSAQVETILTGKKYVNETTLSATSAGLTAQITQVSTDLSNLEIGGRNLIIRNNESKNTILGPTGLPQTASGGSTPKDKIPVTPGEVLTFTKTSGGDNYWRLSWFNSSGVFIAREPSMTNQFTWTVPANAYYIWTSYPSEVEVKIERGNKSTDWSPAPEDMATVESVVTIEANINGINTTVAAKADKTQITQLSNQISTKVESATYNSKMTQLDREINLRVVAKDVTDAILADKTVKDTRSTNELPAYYYTNYKRQSVDEFKSLAVLGIEGSGFGLLTTNVAWSDSSGGAVTQSFSTATGVYQRQGTNGWGAWEKVADANRLIAQINLSAETSTVLIQGRRILLDGNVTMNAAFITRLDTQTLNAVTANIATIRTKMLTADVILSTMIKSDTALVTKIFATDANVSILTAKTAFINSVKAIDISADRVTAGTLNAAKVTIINLDASRITTGVLNGIKITSSFNYSYDGAIMNSGVTTMANGEITMNGNFTHSYGGTFLKINPDAIYAENLQANGAVRSMFKLSGVGLELNASGSTAKYTQDGIYFQSGGNASVKYNKGDARIEISSYNGVSLGVNSSGTFYYRISTGGGQDGLAPFVDIWTDLNLRSTLNVGGNTVKNAAHITGVQDILFANTSNRIVQGSDNILNIMSPAQINMGYTNGSTTSNSLIISNWGTQFTKQVNFNGNAIQGASNLNGIKTMLFEGSSNRIVQGTDGFFNILAPIQLNLGWTNGSSTFNTMVITQNQIVARRNLNMDGNQMVGVSDSRLKTAINSTVIDSLSAISRWKFVDFNWKYDDKPKGRQFGLIAQDTPELALYDAQNDEYTISASKQIMMTSHGLSQLNDKVINLTALTDASNATANQALSEVQILRNEVQELKQKIEQMESAA